MVRPERFELPTLWFVAKYSIQLSYGRTLWFQIKTIDRLSGIQGARKLDWGVRFGSGSGGGCRFRRGLRGNQRQFAGDVKACLQYQLRHGGGGKPCCVVLDA
jgi:hypothetical protein